MKTHTFLLRAVLPALLFFGAAELARADIVMPTPQFPRPVPKLVVVVRPHQADIVLTGKGYRTASKGRLAKKTLPYGDYTLTVSHKGHITETRRLKISRWKKVRIKMILKKSVGKKKGKAPSA